MLIKGKAGQQVVLSASQCTKRPLGLLDRELHDLLAAVTQEHDGTTAIVLAHLCVDGFRGIQRRVGPHGEHEVTIGLLVVPLHIAHEGVAVFQLLHLEVFAVVVGLQEVFHWHRLGDWRQNALVNGYGAHLFSTTHFIAVKTNVCHCCKNLIVNNLITAWGTIPMTK